MRCRRMMNEDVPWAPKPRVSDGSVRKGDECPGSRNQ